LDVPCSAKHGAADSSDVCNSPKSLAKARAKVRNDHTNWPLEQNGSANRPELAAICARILSLQSSKRPAIEDSPLWRKVIPTRIETTRSSVGSCVGNLSLIRCERDFENSKIASVWRQRLRNCYGIGWCHSSPRPADQATGSLGYALIYPIAVPAICFVLSLFLMPETRKMSIWGPETAKA
jgi:hypothetical protein